MRPAAELSAYPPDGMEIRLIERVVRLRNQRVLEIGCGDGRLTLQYAPMASEVLAIDPDRTGIAAAMRQQASAETYRNVTFQVSSIERLPEHGAPFDVALFSWSL